MRAGLLSILLFAYAPFVNAAPLPQPSVVRPSAAELERAYAKHDAVEVERLSRRLGAPRLLALAEHGTGKPQEAALAGLATIDESLELLPRIVALANGSSNGAVTAAAFETVRRLGERVSRGEAAPDEQPRTEAREAFDQLAAYVMKEDHPAPLRVAAVQAMGTLSSLARSSRLPTLTTVKDPVVRRAVAEALPSSETAALVPLLADDADPFVAASAAATLCRDVPPPGAEHKDDKALKRAVQLPPAARSRLQTLAADASLDASVRLDIVPCLRRGAQPSAELKADAAVLSTLARGSDAVLKRRARAYGGR